MKQVSGMRPLSLSLSLVMALPVPIIALTLFFGDFAVTGTGAVPPSALLWIAALSFLCFGFAYDTILRLASPLAFAIASITLSMFAQAVVIALGIRVHRDFFSAVFQNLIACLGFFLFWFYSHPVDRTRLRFLSRAGYALFVLFSQWIMMMGYAIVTRAEPRPIEALIYNSYNGFLDVLIIVISRGLLLRSRKTLSVSAEGVTVDGKAVDAFLGKVSKTLLLGFLSARDRQLPCATIQDFIAHRAPRKDGAPESRCSACDPVDSKATLCPAYRRTYNRILDLKKLLEFLEIGTIVSPKNKMKILSQGWKLMLFEGVRIERRKT